MRTKMSGRPGFLNALCLMAAVAFILAPTARESAGADRKIVKVDGSSTVYPITEAVAEEFQIAKKGRTLVTVGISGTGGGFKRFCRGDVDITDASRPIKPEEVVECEKNGIEYIEIPVAYDGIAVVVNPSNNWVRSMKVNDLEKLWEPAAEKKVTRWSQLKKGWPYRKVHLYAPGLGHGTFDYFTKAIVGEQGASRTDYTESDDYNVLAKAVAGDKYALGFFGLAYYEKNKDKLKLVPIDDGDDTNGKGAVYPTRETVDNGTYQPLSRPLFIYVNKKAASREEIGDYVKFYIKNAGRLGVEVGYIPLPAELYKLARKRFDMRKTGTVFGGVGARKGVRISDLLKME